MEPQPSRIDRLKVTAQEREDYYHESKNLLDQLQLPTEVWNCQNVDCTDEKHLEEIENLYAELTSALLAAASSAIKTTGKKNEGKFNIPGWNSVVNQNTKLQRKPSDYGQARSQGRGNGDNCAPPQFQTLHQTFLEWSSFWCVNQRNTSVQINDTACGTYCHYL